ncbi:hypothetical protein CALVIDRAFT_601426 [Calocera viscosa TUFC12733]|uniref:HMG box domain-containing protein n=1 Tax=Calocera viscosa (strain TUFC12733) TaxID=1330018 RepID=A0A167IG62_CALVF|nr:hypothetical protein CALVIDRAFT_601426 [Calocera viscosa TUFC12733]
MKSCDSDYQNSPVPFAPTTLKPARMIRRERQPRNWSKTTMPPARPPKKDPTFDPSKYEFEFAPYDTSSTALGYEGLLEMFPRSTSEDDERGHIKRVSNMFFVFRTHFTKTYKNVLDPKTGRPRHPIPEKDISRMGAWVWNFQMTSAERRPYFDTYLQLKHEHEQDHPDYKYQPTRPEDAERMKNEKARQRMEELQKQKEAAAAKRERDEEERKIAKISKKKWAAMKREQRRQNEENSIPDLRLNKAVSSEYASASPYSFNSTPLKSMGYLGVNSPAFSAHSRSPSDLFALSGGLKEPSPMPLSAPWSGFNNNQPSRQGTPATRQPIEVPKLISTPVRQAVTLPPMNLQTVSPAVPLRENKIMMYFSQPQNGLGLQFQMPSVMSYPGLQEQSLPSSFAAMTPLQTPIRNMQSPFTGADWRPVAGLPARAHATGACDEAPPAYSSLTQFGSPSPMTPQYQQNAAPYYTPPQTAPAKRIRAFSPTPIIAPAPGKPATMNSSWQTYTPVTPVPFNSSTAKDRMIWGVSPQSEKIEKRLEFAARTSPAPEDVRICLSTDTCFDFDVEKQDDARGLISPRQASNQHDEAATGDLNSDPFIDAACPPRQKRKVSQTGQGGRSREPSYSAPPNDSAPSDRLIAGMQNELEDVFAAQRRALQDGTSQDFGYMGKQLHVNTALFAGAPADMADWMGQSSMEYLPPRSSQPMSPTDHIKYDGSLDNATSPAASPRTQRTNSTVDAYDLVSTFSAGFVHGPDYENRVGNISDFAFGPGGPMGLMPEIRPVRSLSSSSPSAAASPRDEIVGSDDDSERAMSQFFDFTSGSEESPNRVVSQAASPVGARA